MLLAQIIKRSQHFLSVLQGTLLEKGFTAYIIAITILIIGEDRYAILKVKVKP